MWMILGVAILGWLGGVLVNYLSDVLPIKRRFTKPICTRCFEPQPVWRYLIWPRRCDHCTYWRPWRSWVVEFAFIAISIWLWLAPPPTFGYLVGMILLLYFGVVTVIDLEHRLILHPVSITGAILALLFGVWQRGLLETLLGGAAGFGMMWLFYLLGEVFTKWMARRRGDAINEVALGFGDVNLAGILGLLLGWPGIVLGLFLTILLGGAVSLIYILGAIVFRRYSVFTAIPYGPFLVASAVILLFFNTAFLNFIR